MPETQSSQVIEEVRKAVRINEINGITRLVGNHIIPVVEVNPFIIKNSKCKGVALNDSTAATILTTSTTADTYILGASLAFAKDATATTTEIYINYVDDLGATIKLLYLPTITLTADTNAVSMQTTHPIKVKRGTNIALASETAVGTIKARAVINFFLDENANS